MSEHAGLRENDYKPCHVRFSYGTILGATFAAMRPDLVRRMVLDGVGDSESYFNDVLQWGKDGMAETHKVGLNTEDQV